MGLNISLPDINAKHNQTIKSVATLTLQDCSNNAACYIQPVAMAICMGKCMLNRTHKL